ncbi:MAG TPA: DUF1285 domain-containing protein [Alphaproteobacteria bacterium]|nr:DUF1285 domain-containing protein [Alphaproteobacteria bacterium]
MNKASTEAAKLANQIGVAPSGAARPEPGRGATPEPFCGDIDMRIARDGNWHYRGSLIGRLALVKLFASVLRRDGAGDYWLVTPYERARIQVDDAPFTAVALVAEGAGRAQRLAFRTNLDEVAVAGPEHPIRVAENAATGEPSPYILVRAGRDGAPGLEALIARPVYYQLADLGVEEDGDGAQGFGVWSEGAFFPLGRLDGAGAAS